ALNFPNSLESCLRRQLPRGVDLLQVVADRADVDAEQLGHASLVEPEGLGLIEYLDAHGVISRAVEDQLTFLRGLVRHSCPPGRVWRFPLASKLFEQVPPNAARSRDRMFASTAKTVHQMENSPVARAVSTICSRSSTVSF